MIAKRIAPIALAFAMTAFFVPSRAHAQVSVSFSYFHDSLAPYGTWVSVGGYGNCWRPARVSAGWQPYLDGEWLYTDYGWSWVSYDSWGSIPYHYGTWIFEEPYGWIWVPGNVWAPAWVTWCYGDGYVGWAPVPASFSIGYSGYSGDPVVLPSSRYVFVAANRFVGTRVSSVRLDPARNSALLPRTRKVTRFASSGGILRTAGPSVRDVEQMGHTRIHKASASRLRSQPTRISAAGARGSHFSVVMPERARVSRKTAPSVRTRSSAKGHAPAHERGNRAVRQAPEKGPSARSTTTRERQARPNRPRVSPHHQTAPPRQKAAPRPHARTTAHPNVRTPHERQARPPAESRAVPHRRAAPAPRHEQPAARRPAPAREPHAVAQPPQGHAVRPPPRRPERHQPDRSQKNQKKKEDHPHGGGALRANFEF